jgi:hypothetical protein
MKSVALGLSVLMVVACLVVLAAPDTVVGITQAWLTPNGLLAIGALRVVLGLVLVVGAPASRAPMTVRMLGGVVIIAGLTTPWLGVDRARAIVDWWSGQGVVTMRVSAACAVALTGLLVYAFTGKSGTSMGSNR